MLKKIYLYDPWSFRRALFVIYGTKGLSVSEKEFYEDGKSIAELVSKKLELTKDSIVLEIGCGVGRVTKHISKECKLIYAVDNKPKMIKYAKEKVKEKNVIFETITSPWLSNYKEDYFDAVFSIATFFHLSLTTIYSYCEEVYRVLKPNGRFMFNFLDIQYSSHFKMFTEESNRLKHKQVSQNLQFTDVAILEEILKSFGFTILEITPNDSISPSNPRKCILARKKDKLLVKQMKDTPFL